MNASFAIHPMEDGQPPAWASAWGHDRYGVWASFAVGRGEQRVEQRMRWIVAGDFTLGSPETEDGRWKDEGPQRRVRISRGFWLADTSCTQALWQAVMDSNPSRFKGAQRPVEQVSFVDVDAFLVGLAERVPDLLPRLPSEAEWEYACRAGFEDLPVYPRPGESVPAALSDVAWYRDNADSIQPVARKLPNQWGLHDMLGNVWEWCRDDWHDYEGRHKFDGGPLVVDNEPANRVVRGGSWLHEQRFVRAAFRHSFVPTYAYDNLGFRLAQGQG